MFHFSGRVHKNWVTFQVVPGWFPVVEAHHPTVSSADTQECATGLGEAQAAGGVGAVPPPAEPEPALAVESCWEMESSRLGAVTPYPACNTWLPLLKSSSDSVVQH